MGEEEDEEGSGGLRFPVSQEDVADVLGFDFIPAQVEVPSAIFRARRGGSESIEYSTIYSIFYYI